MEKLVESYDKEDMKMAMLKHEQTFRQQVYELHRLYRIQKMLMKDIQENKARRSERWNVRRNEVFLRKKEEEFDLEEQQPVAEEIMDESEIELTLGPSSYNHRRRKKAGTTDTKPASDSAATSLSSSSTGSVHGSKQQTRNFRDRQQQLVLGGSSQMGFVGFLEANSACQNSSSVVEVEDDQMRLTQHHPWLYQVVSLNLT